MSKEIVVKAENLSKIYKLYDHPIDRLIESLHPFKKQYHRDFYALKDVNLEIRRGEAIGIIGKNGAGKSTLLKVIAGILLPTMGSLQVNGRVAALLELGAGFNPEYSGMENIFLQGFIMGYSREEMKHKAGDIIAFAGIEDFINQPVKKYSTGMFIRLAFSIATVVNPDILIIDEALAVGDVFFRQKCFNRMEALKQNNTSIILVSHAMNEVRQFCTKALLLNNGQPVFWGNADEAVQRFYFLERPPEKTSEQLIHFRNEAAPARSKRETENRYDGNLFFDWPSEALFDLEKSAEAVVDGAVCTAAALCNSRREPCRLFVQGETAIFYYEFELLRDIDVPIGGILLFNEKNILVHGKNSLQYDIQAPETVKKGTRIRFRQEIKLSLASGDYTFSLGFASMKKEFFNQKNRLSYKFLEQNRENLCYLRNIGAFSVTTSFDNGIVELPFHGTCDLPGNLHLKIGG
ncbi:MAG: ABC transporter ATP-binding protein [Bacillota bacterium]